MAKILVTGTAGFIGFHVAEALLQRGDTVIGIDNINDYYDTDLKFARLRSSGIIKEQISWHHPVKSVIHQGYTFLRMNLEDKDLLIELCERESFDTIIHLAAQAGVRYSIDNPEAYGQSNLIGFLNILEAARRINVGHLIYASSSSVYGMNENMPFSVSHNVDHPVSLYAATKKANELMAHSYSHLYNIPTSSLRFFTVYGPWGRPDMAYFLFAEAIRMGKPIKVFNNGKLKRDFTYIDDIVNGILSVADSPAKSNPDWDGHQPDLASSKAPYRIYNIGNNKPVELMKFIETIGSAMNTKPEMIMMDMQQGDVLATWADIEELSKNFGYHPLTTIESGISKFIAWYLDYYKKG